MCSIKFSGGGHNNTNKSKKKASKSKSTLLIEPSIEEERLADENSFDFTTFKNQHNINNMNSTKLKQKSDITYMNNNNMNMNHNSSNKKIVISNDNEVSSSSSSSSNYHRQQRQRTRQKSDLTSLLMILFGSICLLIGCLTLQLIKIQPTMAASTTFNNSISNNTVTSTKPLKVNFELNLAKIAAKSTTTTTTTTKPTTTATNLNILSTPKPLLQNKTLTGNNLLNISSDNKTTNLPLPELNDNEEFPSFNSSSNSSKLNENDSTLSSFNSSSSAVVRDNNADGGELEIEDDNNNNGKVGGELLLLDKEEESGDESEDSNKNKLSDLILSTANDAADLLINKLKSSKEENENEDTETIEDGEDNNESTSSTEASISITAAAAAAVALNNSTNNNNNNVELERNRLVEEEMKEFAKNELERKNKKRKRKKNYDYDDLVDGNNEELKKISELNDKIKNDELKVAFDTYIKWKTTGDDVIDLFSKKLLPLIVEHGYDIDPTTISGVLQIFNAIKSLKPWALKLLDSWTKLAPGVLVGTQSDFGDYDECLSIRVDDPNNFELLNPEIPIEYDELTGLKKTTIIGKYCLADVEFPKPPRDRLLKKNFDLNSDFKPIELRNPLLNFNETILFKDTIFVETANFFHMLYVDPIRVGFCLTNKIDHLSFEKVFNILIKDFRVKINFNDRCITKYDKIQWTYQQNISAYIIITICSLVCLCTLLDLLHLKLNKLPLPTRLIFFFFIKKRSHINNKDKDKDKNREDERIKLWKLNLKSKLFKYRPLFTSFSIIRNTKRLFKPQAQQQQQLQQQELKTSSNLMKNLNLNHQSNIILFNNNNNNNNKSIGCNGSISTDSSPSIERRRDSASISSSALNLISSSSSSSCSTSSIAAAAVAAAAAYSTNGHQHSSDIIIIDNKPNLLCLHGIRVITMTWMIVNHTYLFGGFFVLWAHRRLIDIAEWPKSLSFQLVLNGWLTVETYFFLSALIIVLNVMPLFKKKKFFYFKYILHRLLRLLPAYIGLICLNFLWPLISSGPVWLVKGKSFIQTPCENYLWTNLLFINNWIWPEKQCMVHTWFLSADLQLYLLAPIIVYLLYRRPVLGHSLNIIIAIIASIVSGLVIYANKLMPTTLINKLEFDSIKQQLSYSYFATYQHMGPYCLGIFTGYLLYKRPKVKLPKHLTWTLWLLLPPLSFTTLLLTYLWNGAYDDPDLINPSPLVSAIYVAIHRTIWTSLVAWIVFACSTGRAKLISNFLSHSIFIPLSRLSFSIYLVHLPVIMFRALNLRHTIEWTDSNILWEACGNFVVSLIVGYFVNVAFESPFINLESIIFSGGKKDLKLKLENNNASNGDNSDEDKLTFSNSVGEQSLASNSPEQEHRKLSNNNNNSTSSQSAETSLEGSPVINQIDRSNKSQWQINLIDQNNQHKEERKTFRPKQISSVERIFGHQLEPQSNNNIEGEDNEDYLDVVYPMNSNARFKLEDSNWASKLKPDFNNTTTNYLNQSNSLIGLSSRSAQYATLARTSRFNHFDNNSRYLSKNFKNLESSYNLDGDNNNFSQNQRNMPIYLKQNHYRFSLMESPPAINNNFSSRSDSNNRKLDLINARETRSHLGGSISSNSNRQLTNINEQQQQQFGGEQSFSPSSQMIMINNNRDNKRHGRYNTLTGSNSLAEWRQKYNDNYPISSNYYKDDSLLFNSNSINYSSNIYGDNSRNNETYPTNVLMFDRNFPLLSNNNDGLQTMIPRIDTSTLRRNKNDRSKISLKQQQHNQVTEASFIEEQTEQQLMGDNNNLSAQL